MSKTSLMWCCLWLLTIVVVMMEHLVHCVRVCVCVCVYDMYVLLTHTHTHTQPYSGLLSWTTWMSQYQKKHSPTYTHPDHQTSFINFLHLLQSIASSLFSLRAWQSCSTTSLQVLFGLPLGLGPSTSLLHTPYISSPNHHVLSATHAHTSATFLL